jgi:hypothetical protein
MAGKPTSSSNSKLVITARDGQKPSKLGKALETALLAETKAADALSDASSRGGKADAAALGKLKLNYLRAAAGSYWSEDHEKRAATRIKRLTASKTLDVPLGRYSGQLAGSLGEAPPASGPGRTMDTRDWQSGYDVRFFDEGGFGTFAYWGGQRDDGDGRIREAKAFAIEGEARTGGLVWLENRSPDNSDYLRASVESGIWFTYTPTRTGRLSLLVEATTFYDSRYRGLDNEHGDSWCRLEQVREFVVGSFDGDTPVGRNYIDISNASRSLTHYYGNGDGAGADWPEIPGGSTVGSVRHIGGEIGAWAVEGKPIDILIGCRIKFDCHLDDVSFYARDGLGLKLNFALIDIRSA